MGLNGYKDLLDQRKQLVNIFRQDLEGVAAAFGEKILDCPRNTISFGITLNTLGECINFSNISLEDVNEHNLAKKKAERTSLFGSMLFTRCISGTRVVPKGQSKTISGERFIGFGSSTNDYPHSYLTAACAIGLSSTESEEFFIRLEKCFGDFFSKYTKHNSQKAVTTSDDIVGEQL
jgi:O-phospho-L-seryl-tRNASec:L-selenocysteinyl-tRNA synthase